MDLNRFWGNQELRILKMLLKVLTSSTFQISVGEKHQCHDLSGLKGYTADHVHHHIVKFCVAQVVHRALTECSARVQLLWQRERLLIP